MNNMNNNINKMINVMDDGINNIASETGLTVSEANELILTVCKFMISRKDDSDKAEMASFVSSMHVYILRVKFMINYLNEQICLISGSSDSAWKIMYLISELFQSLNSVGNKVDDDSTNKNNQSDEKTELKNIINELKELAEFFDIAVISAQQLNRVGASVVDAADDKKSLIVNKKVMGRADYFEKIDLSSCSYISGFDIDIDFLKIKRNNPAVVIRAGYGNRISQKDRKFEEIYKNAKANGLKVGAYWYSYAHTAEEAIQEVRVFLQVIAGKQFDMPIVFDIEQNYLLNNTSVIEMRTEIITLVRSYCNMYGYDVQFITLNEDGKIVTIDNVTN